MQEVEKAYVAGFIDGEGCVSVYKTKEGWIQGRLTVCNTNKEVIEKIRSMIGFGRIYQKKPYKKPEYHKLLYVLEYSIKQSGEVLREVLPYLILKQRQAILLLNLVELHEKSKHGITFEKERQEQILVEIQFLNKKGR